MDLLKRSCIWYNHKVLSILKVLTKYASSSDPSMDWCKHLGVGIYALISWSKHIVLYRLAVKPVFTKKVSGSTTAFLISICEWHIIDRKWCRISGKLKGLFDRRFSKEDLGKAAYILGIKIYRDRSSRLIRLLMSIYLDKILKEFKMDQSKKEFLPEL